CVVSGMGPLGAPVGPNKGVSTLRAILKIQRRYGGKDREPIRERRQTMTAYRLAPEDHRRRREARDNSQMRYRPSRPCKHGHNAPRLVSTNACTQCTRVWRQRARAAEQERLRELYESGISQPVEFKWSDDGESYELVPVKDPK